MIIAITGGAGALGAVLAETLVARGYRVALFDTERSKARAEDLAAKLGGPTKVIAHAGDFADAATWTSAIDAVKKAFGAAPTHAALVAGGWEGGAPVHAAKDDAAYEHMMKANVDTVYRALR